MNNEISIQVTETIINLKITAEKYRILKEYINKARWWGKEDLIKFIDILDEITTPEDAKEEKGENKNE